MKSLDRSQFGPSMLLRFARPDGRLRATNYADPLMKMPVQLVNHRQGVDYFVNQFDNMIQSSISITVDSCSAIQWLFMNLSLEYLTYIYFYVL